jgi:hypothetical protein
VSKKIEVDRATIANVKASVEESWPFAWAVSEAAKKSCTVTYDDIDDGGGEPITVERDVELQRAIKAGVRTFDISVPGAAGDRHLHRKCYALHFVCVGMTVSVLCDLL